MRECCRRCWVSGCTGAVVRHYYDFDDDLARQRAHVTSVVLFQAIFSGVVILALNFWGPGLWLRFTRNTIPFDPFVRIVLFTIYLDLLMQIPIALYQAQQRAKQFTYVQFGRFLLGTLNALWLVVFLRMGAQGVLLSQLLAAAFVAVVVLYLAAQGWFSKKIAWSYVGMSLVYGLPLSLPHALARWVLQAADRLVLERYVSLTEIGLYNFGYTLGMAMLFLVLGINQAWSPHYYGMMKADEAENPPTMSKLKPQL